ncbi:hypothetical protein OD350_13820 [Clostridium beijerinckii]|uniref:hypothetical protein n=1 Tax=Clostridium beijerinckii TaxID=1520 RepID=UPI00156ED40D|nr:hypothetical protein [Clostridium beijerinckii]NRT44491.1 hypothetical protein [Clostridium beijerinckii]UYZ38693.1 hypothetical protein OD350_13820 [Clostridium beijerinckii]
MEKKISNINKRKCGVGTSALIISIFSIMFSFTSLGEKSIGENILAAVGIRFPVMVISMILFIISAFIGHKYIENYGAKVGRNISVFFIILMVVLTIKSL